MALLAANDAVFKAWAGAGAWAPVTGKLSDLAGAIVLPALLEVIFARLLPRAHRVIAALSATLVAGVALILLETSPAFVGLYVAASQSLFDVLHLPWRAASTMDITDLVALPLVTLCLVPHRLLPLVSRPVGLVPCRLSRR